jgi:cytochrome c556
MIKSSLVTLLLAAAGTARVKATSPEPEKRMDRFTAMKEVNRLSSEFLSEPVHGSLQADSNLMCN